MPGSEPKKEATNKPAARTDGVGERLRQAILRGELRPNQRLVEVELASWLGVSRTPIRQSLQLLEVDGLVELSRHGWVVRDHSPSDIAAIYEVRAALEGAAAALAAERASPSQLAEIERRLETIEQMNERNPRLLTELNDAFHEAVLEAAGNPMLSNLARRARLYYFNYRVAALYPPDELQASYAEHVRLVEAIRRRDATLAEEVARAHVRNALRIVLATTEPGHRALPM